MFIDRSIVIDLIYFDIVRYLRIIWILLGCKLGVYKRGIVNREL